MLASTRPDVLAARIAPGSLMKLVTLVAAFDHGVAGPDTRILCRRTIDVDGRSLTCVHPDVHRPLSPPEAVGHSCNYYFATLARRVPRDAIDRVLVRLALRPARPAGPLVPVALGLDGVSATPAEWLEAFRRLTGTSSTSVRLSDAARTALREGLELAATSGTADALGLAGFNALAKTGTAPMPGGGYHGLAVVIVSPELPTHAIVVVAPGATGAHAARVAADLLAAHGVARRSSSVTVPGTSTVPGTVTLRVGTARRDTGYDVAEVDLEDYVARGVAGEAPPELPRAAAEALALTVRTFALANRGRHRLEGFDLCDLTHCLSLRPATAPARQAARATAGRVLTGEGRVAEVYLSAWCGGHTERPSRVWEGASDPPHLPATRDAACEGDEPWVSDLTAAQIRRVTQAAGHRGQRIDNLAVAVRSESGRARRLAVRGQQPDTLSANTFRILAGRHLGWQWIKSTLFDVSRTGTGYRFTGRGFGHGVGLCVRGAAGRARGGDSAAEILAAYFPGLTVAAAPRTVVRVLLPEADRARLADIRGRADALVRELAADLDVGVPGGIDVRFHATVEAYTRETGLPRWTAGRTRGTRIDMVPAGVLAARGILESALRHELVHVLADPFLADRPLWVREGLARVKAGESSNPGTAPEVMPLPAGTRPACPSDADLRSPGSPEAWRRAYDGAGLCVARALAGGTRWRDLR